MLASGAARAESEKQDFLAQYARVRAQSAAASAATAQAAATAAQVSAGAAQIAANTAQASATTAATAAAAAQTTATNAATAAANAQTTATNAATAATNAGNAATAAQTTATNAGNAATAAQTTATNAGNAAAAAQTTANNAAAAAAAAQADATAALAGLPQKRTLNVTPANLIVGALTATLNIGAVLPANARIIGREIRTTVALSGGLIAAVVVDIGVAGGSEIVLGASIFTGAPAAQAGVSGIDPFGSFGGQQLTAKVTATGAFLNALVAGNVTIDVIFVVLA